MTNWFGLEPHETDSYIHWACRNPVDEANTLRNAYNQIVILGCKKELSLLLRASYDAGSSDEADNNNPDL